MGTFLDLTKAFDSIDIDILINKLSYYGINGPFKDLLSSYLTNRYIFTQVNGMFSSTKLINVGVPQGSVIGPILFILYINDIKSLTKYKCCEIRCFADDTSIFTNAADYKSLELTTNNILKKTYTWLCTNKLSLNLDKTNILIFNKRYQEVKIDIKIGNKKIPEATNTKYLGLYMQSNLKWDTHINNLINRLNKLIPVFYNIRNILTERNKILVYNAIATSKINYAIELYGTKNTKWLKQLQVTQNRLLKILFHKHRLHSTQALHSGLNILKITDLNNFRLNILIFDHRQKLQRQCRYSLRNHRDLPTTSDSYSYINKIFDSAIIYWNRLTNAEKNVIIRQEFKDVIRSRLISQYDTDPR